MGFTSAGLASVTSFHVRPKASGEATTAVAEDRGAGSASHRPPPPPPPRRPRAPSPSPGDVPPPAPRSQPRQTRALTRSRDHGDDGQGQEAGPGVVAVPGPPPRASPGRQDVTCPACGRVFPPATQLMFLDHFEECALARAGRGTHSPAPAPP